MIFVEKSLNTYRKYSDRSLVNLATYGDFLAEQYLIKKYKKMVKIKARAYFLVGADAEDVIQEGMIGLFKAVRSYDYQKLTSFKAFAEICIHRQIVTAIKMASRQKHKPLNFSISLNQPAYSGDSERTLVEVIDDTQINDPMSFIVTQEKFEELKGKLKKILSKLEKTVLENYLAGMAYHEIAKEINKSTKSIDNAMQRIKRKLEIIAKLN